MNIQRKITSEIGKWYSDSTSGLLVDGARQVGKTTSVRNFLTENRIDYVELNLADNDLAKEAFDDSENAHQLMMRISSLAGKTLHKGKTVIFIDEIQEAKDAITPIKFLVSNTDFRFVFSGSLLGVKMQEIASVPVGFLEILQMYPLDFEEFARASGVTDEILSYLRDCYTSVRKVDPIIHKQMLSLFQTYLAVGGMPKAVSVFLASNDIGKVNRVLKEIDDGYRLDIARYRREDALLIQDIYDLIPSELNCQNKRFILKDLNEKARFYRLETSFTWIKNSGVGLFVHNVDNPVYPLLASKERTLFKLFPSDVGLLTYRLFGGKQSVLLGKNTNLNFGAVYEAVTAQELKAHGYDLYYNSDKKRGEIDFLIEKGSEVIPVEVKSGKDYRRHSAMTQLLASPAFGIAQGIVLSNENTDRKEKVIYYPVYMLMFLEKEKPDDRQIVHLDISRLI